ncbi:TetR family transcriptional regulator [Conyzicola nivalis]|uniref:TetR family transcriptional regulator n=1 Tax=Conyzicola nivalis TaxID=1477021 RepID=A0A916SHG6_9MICO|nr:TetR/AcrR family transcriptional regulator [Conyzicola nivalis]GGB01110.1 TetR family transcriptional regulator [Conyzicola nivalis]
MKDQSALLPNSASVRTEPVQQRSSERITLLLDTAASLIDEKGIDGLTTSDVAARSHSSVGVVYRYFPNIQSLLRALAARNMQRFLSAVFVTIEENPGGWLSELDAILDIYADLTRSEPGFRALHFGDVIDERFIDGQTNANKELATNLVQFLTARYELPQTEEFELDLDVAIEIASALMQRAFRVDRNGDERYLAKARFVVREVLEPYRREGQ